ncbi:unnamed protein product [Cercopithifilaria johnstoni]|uniref:Uncharacterized protein n=1 Tax=Cercopithifilaria johnstoni TaxID=2874296 RepID=A0A8J2M5D2_9BILA|nr:unnamed protein product [Cercopithifilaria johnstoni]
MIENDVISNEIDITAQDISSSHSSDNNSSLGRLQNIDSETNSIKDKGDQKDHLREKEIKKKEKKMEEKEGITRSLPIRLIRQPSEEGFHQVVKFIKRITRRGETEISESKSFNHIELNEGKSSSEKKDLCDVPVSKDLTNQELNNRTICMEQNLSAEIQSQPEYCDPTDKSCLRSANDDTTELNFLSCESICAKLKETHGTMVEADDLSQSIQKQHDQEKCDMTEIYREIGGPQINNKSEMFVLACYLNLYIFLVYCGFEL